MQKKAVVFQEVFDQWNWLPIPNCPGRFIFAEGSTELTVNDIARVKLPVYEFETEVVPDKVIIIEFGDGGGLIFYIKMQVNFFIRLIMKTVLPENSGSLKIVLSADE